MHPIARKLLLACFLTSIIGAAACGTLDTSGPDSARGYKVTRCDGSPIAHASLSKQPASAQASVYFGTAGSIGGRMNGVFALAAADGAPRWCAHFDLTRAYTCPPGGRCPPPPIALVGSPLVAGGVVYVCVSGGSPGILYALNAADGALRWSRQTGCQSVSIPFQDDAQPILAGGVLYSGAFGLAPADGSVLWHLPPQLAQSTIGAVADGVAYVHDEETISAVRLTDSKVIWTYTLDDAIGDRPVPVGNHLYVGGIGSELGTYALETRTGAVVWRAPTGIVSGSSAVEVGGLVYIGGEYALYAIDTQSGVIRWRRQVAQGKSVQNTPAVSNDVVYFVSDGAYAADAATGAVRWHNALGSDLSKTFVGPALRDGTLYVAIMDGGGQGTLYALDATSGAILWQRAGFNQIGTPAA